MVNWQHVFDSCASKVVTPTDKNKGAYVPTAPQCQVIANAGVLPSTQRPADPFTITVLGEPQVPSVQASYYEAERAGAGRRPEPRLGREFISSWLQVDDEVLLGNIGPQLFAVRTQRASLSTEDVRAHVLSKVRPEIVFERAAAARGQPAERQVTRRDFVRNPYVVQAALIRANGRCEMPGCHRDLFVRPDHTPYLEVHHAIPLAEGGDDTLANVAALCPHCHRELHHGMWRMQLRERLLAYLAESYGGI